MIPEFAVLGHPNEGKSSVVSTLTEDDRINVSPVPGETTVSRQYTVTIDGEKLIRFSDTPGFQVPQQTLAWFKQYDGVPGQIVPCFIEQFENDPFFSDDCELLRPLARGAGIIYVVDGSRPVRPDDLAEMEILRLTGRPRMAVINSKTEKRDYSADWKLEFCKHFNAIRLFNSNTANFTDRILMLESLKSIDQEWEPVLNRVVSAFRSDWDKRNKMAGAIILKAIDAGLSFSVSEKIGDDTDIKKLEQDLAARYQAHIKAVEKLMFQKIRQMFKHRLFEFRLPDYSVLRHDLFSEQTWALLGLTKKQLTAAGAVAGGAVGAVLDTAAAGISFGVFTAIGSLVGAGSAIFSGEKIAGKKTAGLRLGGNMIRLGPCRNLQFLYVLLDRALIYYSHMINRPHGRRDLREGFPSDKETKQGPSSVFTGTQQAVCAKYFRAVTGRSPFRGKKAEQAFKRLIESVLADIAKT